MVATTVTLGMVFSTAGRIPEAKGFGAVELGLQTLGKLETFPRRGGVVRVQLLPPG